MAALDGLKILVPESRELDLFASMLEAEGARALRCPMVRITDLEDTSAAKIWIEQLTSRPFDFTVLLTGDGLRKLLAIAAPQESDLIAALAKTAIVPRGPKPVRALREVGLAPSLTPAIPTSQGVLDALAQQDLSGRSIGVQLYPGDGAQPLVDGLRARGAEIFAVTPYRYATDAESGQVVRAIDAVAAGEIGLIAFTSSQQIERLFAVARDAGKEQAVRDGLARTPIAAVGPVMEQALAAHGLKSVVHPQASFHLKPLVRAIVTWRVA